MNGDAMDDLLEAKAAHIETEGDEDSTALAWIHSRATPTSTCPGVGLLFHPGSMRKNSKLAQQQEATGHCASE